MNKNYTDLIKLATFEDRFKYLQLKGKIGDETFGFDRYLNQVFYRSQEWRRIRNQVILRDNGCDLGIEDRPIPDTIYIHHMNPLLLKDIVDRTDILLNPEYLICVSHNTHNAIHYGDENLLMKSTVIERTPFDTAPWRH